MNCIDYRRQYTADPNNSDALLIAHRESCADCTEFTTRMQSFETELVDTANIDVPEGLESRIMLHTLHKAQQDKKQQRLYAVAASIVFALGLYVFLAPANIQIQETLSLDKVVLQHINNEMNHLTEKKNVQLAKLNKVLLPFGRQANQSIGQINYAGACDIRNKAGAHIVLQGEAGPVTVMIMPGEKLAARKLIQSSDFNGVIVPTSNGGSIAIVGQPNEELEKIEQQLSRALLTS